MSIKENLYNMSRKADFIEETIKEEITERQKTKNKKIQEHNLKMNLQNHFYCYFKKYQGNTKTDLIDFYDIEIREKIIEKLGEDEDEDIKGYKMTYLNSIYSKTLKEISQIFKDNDKFLESQKPKKSFYESCAETIDLFEQCQYKPPKTKTNKNGFILFLNIILGLWDKK